MKITVDQFQNGMSSVSGINGELSHLTASLFAEVEESSFCFNCDVEGIVETAELVEKG